MPTQDNCDDLKVESCVDENGQTINGGDSYEVPTGRYVKHVVNVCGSGGSGSGMKVCPGGGLELIGADDAQCMQIITEPDGALVLDNGILKIDSTKVKVTSDNVFPAGTDPGLVSALPVFTDPDGNVWNNQSDYNIWLYEQQKGFLHKHGHNVDDAPGLAKYHWNEGVYLQGAEDGGTGSFIVMKDDMNVISPRNITLSADNMMSLSAYKGAITIGAHTDLLMSATDGNVNLGASKGTTWIESKEQDVILKADVGTERIDRVIDDTSDPKQIVNKEYVDQAITDNVPPAATQMVYWGILPKNAPQGALWTDQDTLKMYVHTGGGTWAQIAQCAGDDTDTIVETPWIRIDEMRVLRQYSGFTHGSDDHITKILFADYHYNDRFPSTITDEWERDENGDGNWVTYDPRTDSEADSRLDDSNYFYYLWSCEAGSGYPPMDVNHPHPCAKLRTRLTNTWDDGQSETSDWFEVWLAKEQNPAMNYPYQAPSIC
jgi:hypothetical protein